MTIAKIDLDNLSDEDLLKLRIKDLGLKIEGTWLEECVNALYAEIEAKGIKFKPLCYLADEWLTPDVEPIVGVPFFLAHPALTRLEKQMMLEAEGSNKEWCMKLLRHETGHAINYAYNFYKRRKWKKIFGSFDKEYKDTYRFRPYSRSFVRHLEDYYAQYHPDEDFSETFSVWLTPGMDWKTQYRGWKALSKLKYVDELMSEIKDKEPIRKIGRKYWDASRLTSTLSNYYKKKRRCYQEDFADFHDTNLYRIFSARGEENKDQPQSCLLINKYRKYIVDNVCRWTGEKKFIIDDLVKTLTARCRQLNLVCLDEEPLAMLKISTYVTTLMMNYMYTGRLRGKK